MQSPAVAGLVVLALLAVPNPDRADCGNIGGRYGSAVARLGEALRAYMGCVAASDRRHDCAAEMQALDDAHDDFAEAVADAKDCQ